MVGPDEWSSNYVRICGNERKEQNSAYSKTVPALFLKFKNVIAKASQQCWIFLSFFLHRKKPSQLIIKLNLENFVCYFPPMTMEIKYIPSYILLSVSVAILASYVAMSLAYNVTNTKGRTQKQWLTGGAIAMGLGIWSMHFIGMFAVEVSGMEMAYDIPLMFLSIAVAIIGSGLALHIVSRPSVDVKSFVAGGVAMAMAITGMHYIGTVSYTHLIAHIISLVITRLVS